ncbi:phosphoribosylamine--glycine ligase [Candidatus Kaiserbacteria bacterium]|nr:phosphoribosylamine--glycine ligase [Candidatus Kaiserbacteria bacterium]
MDVLILGSGGREHALGWKVAQSPLVKKLYFAPGNAGTSALGENVKVDVADHPALAAFCRERGISLVVVGPDDLLAAGIVDTLTVAGILVFGPTKAAAEIEWSKAFAKRLMQEEGIPTAASETFSDFRKALVYMKKHLLPLVIKADGLALGKGVIIARTQAEAEQALRDLMLEKKLGAAAEQVVIEEYLEGEEISVHALCAGTDAILFPSSRDHKRIFDDDQGPNTGGMGVIAPVPGVSAATMKEISAKIILPALKALARHGRAFSGLLYPGIMLTASGPKVIEFNARFGDPETEAYMRLMKSDIVPALVASANSSLKGITLEWSKESVASIAIASGGYPGAYEKRKPISGIEEAERAGAIVFHAGTGRNTEGTPITNGGRVLHVTATGKDLPTALTRAYAAAKHIFFSGAYYRTDIGTKEVQRSAR